jgi:hypothetical protein
MERITSFYEWRRKEWAADVALKNCKGRLGRRRRNIIIAEIAS